MEVDGAIIISFEAASGFVFDFRPSGVNSLRGTGEQAPLGTLSSERRDRSWIESVANQLDTFEWTEDLRGVECLRQDYPSIRHAPHFGTPAELDFLAECFKSKVILLSDWGQGVHQVSLKFLYRRGNVDAVIDYCSDDLRL